MGASFQPYTIDPAVGYQTGGLIYTALATLAYTDTSAKTLFTVPDGAIILAWTLNVTTAFNSDGTDLVNVGVTGTAGKFVLNLDVSTTGLKTSVVAAQIGNVQSGAQAVKGIYANGGSAASTGAMTIACQFYLP